MTEVNASLLRSFIDRIERMHEQRKDIADDIADIYSEAKGVGYDVKVIKAIIAERAKDPEKLKEFAEIVDVYKHALGMI